MHTSRASEAHASRALWEWLKCRLLRLYAAACYAVCKQPFRRTHPSHQLMVWESNFGISFLLKSSFSPSWGVEAFVRTNFTCTAFPSHLVVDPLFCPRGCVWTPGFVGGVVRGPLVAPTGTGAGFRGGGAGRDLTGRDTGARAGRRRDRLDWALQELPYQKVRILLARGLFVKFCRAPVKAM